MQSLGQAGTHVLETVPGLEASAEALPHSSQQLLIMRAALLKARLLAETARAHKEFVTNCYEPDFDPFVYKTWHHCFAVHALDIIPTVQIAQPTHLHVLPEPPV